MDLKEKIRTVPDWPKSGIMFRDITTLLQDPDAFKDAIKILVERYRENPPDVIAGIEARGFIFGGVLSHELGCSFVPVRKKGKLPFQTVREDYALEYGTDTVEVHIDAVKKGQKVVIVDDLIATGGTCLAACKLIEKIGGQVVECAFIIDLPDLGGKKKLEAAGFKSFALVEFEGD
ncbi:MAG: adenine phosphoribosyltransferase [Nanoarchaeota archaeon]